MTKQCTYKGVYKREGGGEVRSQDFTAFYTLISYTILYCRIDLSYANKYSYETPMK